MILIKWGGNGSLRVYRLKVTPGKTIRTLPKWLWPPALLYWNVRALALYLLDSLFQADGSRSSPVNESLSDGVRYVCGADVEGDVAEFGTMSGTTAAILARGLSDGGTSKKLLLFDSFQGLPEADSEIDKESPHVKSGVWSAGTCLVLGPDELRSVCAKFLPEDRVVVHEGWFKDTLPRLPDGTKLALLHVDSDLYQSAIDVLDHCFSRKLVQEGAAIFFDDWNCNKASPAFGERRAWSEVVARYGIVCSEGREYGWAGKKFIVHSYTA